MAPPFSKSEREPKICLIAFLKEFFFVAVVGSRTLLERCLGGERGGEYFDRDSAVECNEGTERERAFLSRPECPESDLLTAVGCLFTLLEW